MKISSNLVAFLENMNCTYLSGTWQQKSYHKGLSTLKKYQGKPMVLHDFFHHSAIISCITFHIWKSVDSETFNKVYRGILRFLSVDRNTRFIEGWTVLRETIVLSNSQCFFQMSVAVNQIIENLVQTYFRLLMCTWPKYALTLSSLLSVLFY